MNYAAKTETGNNPEGNKAMNYDDRYEITTINRPAVRLTALVMALPLILLAGAALATPYTIDRGDGVHVPNPDCHGDCGQPKPVPKPQPPHVGSDRDPVALHKSAPKQVQVYVCKRTGLRYATKAEALRNCKPVVKRKTVRVRKAKVCK